VNSYKKAVENHYRHIKRLKQSTLERYERSLRENCIEYDNKAGNILVIPDLHCPFMHKNAISFLKRVKEVYKPTRVIFLGDIIDNHFSSFHDTDPDGHG